MKRIISLLVLVVLLLGCTQPAGGGGEAGGGAQNGTQPPNQTTGGNQTGAVPTKTTVRIAGFAFNPPTITVKQGDTVVWVNDDSAPHDIKAQGFQSPTLGNGESYEHTFTEAPGEYAYSCGIHPSMQGKVVVTK
jgi:plastocyanin